MELLKRPFFPPTSVLLLLGLIGWGIVGNAFPLSLFFAIDFLFGSIAAFLALFLLGPIPSLIVAVSAAAYTWWLWGHLYAVLVFSLEALFVVVAYGKGRRNIVLSDAIFWGLIGLPSCLLLYRYGLDVPFPSALLIALKQSVNGITNALTASLLRLFVLFALSRRRHKPLLLYRELLFALFLSILFYPLLGGMVGMGRTAFQQQTRETAERLVGTAEEIRKAIDLWLGEKVAHVDALARAASRLPLKPHEELQRLTSWMQQADPEFFNMYVANAEATTVSFSPPINERGESTIGLSFADRPYFHALCEKKTPVISEVFQGRGGVFVPIVTLAIPIFRQEEMVGFALGALDLTRLQEILRSLTERSSIHLTLTDRQGSVVASTQTDRPPLTPFDPTTIWELVPFLDTVFWGFLPSMQPVPAMHRWGSASFVYRTSLSSPCGWEIIASVSARPTMEQLYAFYIHTLALLLGIGVIAILLALFFSHTLVRSLQSLHRVTEHLPDRIESEETIEWPESAFVEIDVLTKSFQCMHARLLSLFRSLRESRDTLEERIRARTLDLAKSNEDLREEIRKRAAVQETLELHDRAIEAIEEGIVITDTRADNAITFVNAGFERLTGYNREEVLGKNCRILQGKDTDPATRKALREAVKKGNSISVEILNYRKDGTPFWNYLSLAPVRNTQGELTHYVGVLRNITERKSIEADLRQARDQAESANRAKTAFLSFMSHEIRTPMNHIINMARFLQNETLSAQQREYVEILVRSSESLLTLLNDILDLSKIESGALEIESIPFRPRVLLEAAAAVVQPRIRETGLRFSLEWNPELPLVLIGDLTRLRQILLNLLSNAVKFTERGSISVVCRGFPSPEGRCQFEVTVADTGIGIPDSRKKEIFRRFQQGDSSTTRRYGGTGLGLAISQELAELMGGTITVEDNPGGGSIFRLRLNLPIGDTASLIEATDEAGDLATWSPPRKLTILLVDDDTTNQIIVREMLRSLDCVIETAKNGREAVEAFHRQTFDLILMDIHMPEMDGYEATRTIRRLEREEQRPPIPILAMTALAFREELAPCLEAGMNDRLIKPIERRELIATLRKYVTTPLPVADATPSLPSPLLTFPEVEGIDPYQGLAHCGDSLDLYLEALHDLCQSFPNLSERLAAESIPLSEKRFLLHKLRGRAGMVGAASLHHLAGLLEAKVEQGEALTEAERQGLSAELEIILASAKRLSAFLESRSSTSISQPVEDSETLEQAFTVLFTRFADKSLSLEPEISILRGSLADRVDGALLHAFDEATQELRFDEASVILRRIYETWKGTTSSLPKESLNDRI